MEKAHVAIENIAIPRLPAVVLFLFFFWLIFYFSPSCTPMAG
jgi:hypothetical protein